MRTGFFFGRQIATVPHPRLVRFCTRMISDRIGRDELLLPLLNQQEVERVVVITNNHKLFWHRAV